MHIFNTFYFAILFSCSFPIQSGRGFNQIGYSIRWAIPSGRDFNQIGGTRRVKAAVAMPFATPLRESMISVLRADQWRAADGRVIDNQPYNTHAIMYSLASSVNFRTIASVNLPPVADKSVSLQSKFVSLQSKFVSLQSKFVSLQRKSPSLQGKVLKVS